MNNFLYYIQTYFSDFIIVTVSLLIIVFLMKTIVKEQFVGSRQARPPGTFPFFTTTRSDATKQPVGAVCRIHRDCQTQLCENRRCRKKNETDYYLHTTLV